MELLVFCLLSISIILGFLTVLAFSDSSNFVKWFTPIYWMSRKLGGEKAASFDRTMAVVFGTVSLSVLLLFSFFLGGWFITAALNLYSSPFAKWIWGSG